MSSYCPWCGEDSIEERNYMDSRPIPSNSPVCFNCHTAYPRNALPGRTLRELQKKAAAIGMPLREFEAMKEKAEKLDEIVAYSNQLRKELTDKYKLALMLLRMTRAELEYVVTTGNYTLIVDFDRDDRLLAEVERMEKMVKEFSG